MRLLPLAPILLLAGAVAANYPNTCRACLFTRGSVDFSCQCEDYDGNLQQTTVDLGNCFVNEGGHLQYGPGGRFERTCENIHVLPRLSDGSDTLEAECGNGQGGLTKNALPLVRYLRNINGNLICHGEG